MDKKAKIFLIVAAVIVIIVALFLPNNTVKENYKLETFTCSDVSENQENDSNLTKISCSQYIEKIEAEENNLILIARPTCSACTAYIPILEEIVEEYDITINYFNTDALSKTELSDFYESSDLYKSNNFGTPTLLITNNKEILDFSIGYKDKDVAVKWLKETGIIK